MEVINLELNKKERDSLYYILTKISRMVKEENGSYVLQTKNDGFIRKLEITAEEKNMIEKIRSLI